jgi:uncharacterized protein
MRCRGFPFALIFIVWPLFGYCQDIPRPRGWVNDFAQVITPQEQERLDSLIQRIQDRTGVEIVVVTLSSIAPYDKKEYARKLFDNWKPGKIGKDNGLLVLLVVADKRWRIETGYGLEGVLPDGLCGEIGRNYMVPYFKEGRYGEGLYQGLVRICEVILQERGDSQKISRQGPSIWEAMFVFILFPIVVLIIVFSNIFQSRYRRSRRYGSGDYASHPWGGAGGGLGGFGGGGFGGGLGGGGGAGGGF